MSNKTCKIKVCNVMDNKKGKCIKNIMAYVCPIDFQINNYTADIYTIVAQGFSPAF